MVFRLSIDISLILDDPRRLSKLRTYVEFNCQNNADCKLLPCFIPSGFGALSNDITLYMYVTVVDGKVS